MATPHPRSSIVPYLPPAIVGPMEQNPPGYGGGSGGTIATNVLENPKLAGYWDLINAWGKLYPGPVVNRGNLGGPGPIRNNQPVADRQTLTMAARASGDPNHPLPNTEPYHHPWYDFGAGEDSNRGVTRAGFAQTPRERADLIGILATLYPHGPHPLVVNSQAIGDRPVTTMTNPLPAYNPLTMVKGQAAAQLRTLINHALAQRGLAPLINAPLPVGPTQMGMAR
jgi:hypothetical protein